MDLKKDDLCTKAYIVYNTLVESKWQGKNKFF